VNSEIHPGQGEFFDKKETTSKTMTPQQRYAILMGQTDKTDDSEPIESDFHLPIEKLAEDPQKYIDLYLKTVTEIDTSGIKIGSRDYKEKISLLEKIERAFRVAQFSNFQPLFMADYIQQFNEIKKP
jgi:hypothetical protein